MPDEQKKDTPLDAKGCLVRLYWIALGNVIPLFALLIMLKRKPSFPSFLDIIYWGAITALVFARYIDVRVLKGETTYGAPATLRHWRNYALLVAITATVAWLGARALIWL